MCRNGGGGGGGTVIIFFGRRGASLKTHIFITVGLSTSPLSSFSANLSIVPEHNNRRKKNRIYTYKHEKKKKNPPSYRDDDGLVIYGETIDKQTNRLKTDELIRFRQLFNIVPIFPSVFTKSLF